MSLSLLPLAFIGSVSAHGGVVYPPIWQAGASIPLDEIVNDDAFTDPPARDPNSGRAVKNVKSWLTDQAYTGGIGDQFKKEGPITNDKTNKNLRKWDRCGTNCMKYKNPWAAPGQAPTLGGGCGVFGGNPNGCPWGKDDRPAGSQCGQDEPLGRGGRGTSSFGTDARFYDFPDMITTEWEIGSVQEVAWSSKGGHRGGYTYRLCKMPKGGRTAITEDCFTKNVLEFATNFTMIKAIKNGKSEKGWEQFDQVDLREGTYPEGSVWRPVGRYAYPLALRKDSVIVPANLKRGEYVLGFRWDGSGGNQVWVSCASIKLVKSAAGRSDDNEDDDDDYSLYTAEDYEELEQAFESTRSGEDDEDDDDYDDYSLYTDEDYEELEQAFESTRADEDEDDYDDYSLYSDEDYEELEQNFQNY